MKRYIDRQVLIVKLAALALGALCFVQPQVHAQGMTGYMVMFPSVGLAPGESLRLTLFNPDGPPVRAQAQLHHAGGMNVGFGDGSVRLVQAGVSASFDFNRSDISLAGEPGTGRLQLRASFYISLAEPRRNIDGLVVSMETFSISDGTSNTVFIGEGIPSVPGSGGGNDVLIGGDARDVLMGIIPGQTLRVTIFNPPFSGSEAGSEAQHHPASGHIKVFNRSGNLIVQSDDLVIPPGAFHSFDYNGDALFFAAEPGTNRQQVRIKPIFNFRSERLSRVLASFEILDNSTGKTQVLSGQQCLVFFLGRIPDN